MTVLITVACTLHSCELGSSPGYITFSFEFGLNILWLHRGKTKLCTRKKMLEIIEEPKKCLKFTVFIMGKSELL